jgi:hypothetical protein
MGKELYSRKRNDRVAGTKTLKTMRLREYAEIAKMVPLNTQEYMSRDISYNPDKMDYLF